MAAQNLRIKFSETAIDQDDVETMLTGVLSELGFRFVVAGGGPADERDMLFERDLTDGI